MAHMGTPLVGDSLYGKAREDLKRHMLHCYECEAVHPVTLEKIVFKAPLPKEFRKEIEQNFGSYINFD